MSHTLKALARELNVPLIVLCQLARSAEQEGDPFRMLASLRESGDLEQDADVALILARLTPAQRQAYEQQGATSTTLDRLVQGAVAKHRNGPTGRFELVFEKDTQRFLDTACLAQPPQPEALV